MRWSGRDGYLAAETLGWYVEGELAGDYKTYGDLTVSSRIARGMFTGLLIPFTQLLKIYGAGHLVPADRPLVCE